MEDLVIRSFTPRLALALAALMLPLLAPAALLADVLYVSSGNNVLQVASDGTTSTFASGFNGAGGLAFDSNGNLYVANLNGNTITQVTPGGAKSTFATLPFANSTNPLSGLAIDASDNLYAIGGVSSSQLGVNKVTPSGVVSTYYRGLTPGASQLTFDSSGNLYAAPYGSGRVAVIFPGGSAAFLSAGATTPVGLAFDSTGNLYTGDGTNNNIWKGTLGGSFSVFASGFNNPQGLAFDSNGNLYVADNSNNRLAKVTPAGSVSTFATMPAPLYVAEAIPEPSTLVLLAAAGAVQAAAYAWRRRRGRSGTLDQQTERSV